MELPGRLGQTTTPNCQCARTVTPSPFTSASWPVSHASSCYASGQVRDRQLDYTVKQNRTQKPRCCGRPSQDGRGLSGGQSGVGSQLLGEKVARTGEDVDGAL